MWVQQQANLRNYSTPQHQGVLQQPFQPFLAHALYCYFLHSVIEDYAEMREGIIYSQDQLITLCNPKLLPTERPDTPGKPQRHRQGCRGSANWRTKIQQYKLQMVNVSSLGKKMDKLVSLVRTQRKYRE